MKKRLLVLLGLAGLAVAGALAYGVWLVQWLKTPAFQEALLQRVRGFAGTDVRVKRVEVSLLSGVTLEGVGIANPPPFPGDLLTADGFVLRYSLWPLVRGRFEVQRLSLERPRLGVAMDSRGTFNYERLGGARVPAPSTRGAAAPAEAAAASPSVVPLRVVLSRLSVDDGTVVFTDATRSTLLSVEGLGVRSAFAVDAGVATGKGTVNARTIDVAHRLFVRDVSAPLALTKESFTLSPVRGHAGGGEVQGETTVRFKSGFRYAARLEVKNAEVKRLLEEAHSAALVAGRLEAQAHFEGTGGLATLRGAGKGRITDCRVEHNRSLALVSALLGVPELASPDLDECRAEFTQAGARVTTPVLVLKGKALELTGHGSVNVETSVLDYDLTLALAPALFAKVTRPELRAAFHTRADGFSAIDFRVTGTTLEPKTDIVGRLGRSAAESTVKSMLGRFFGRKKNP